MEYETITGRYYSLWLGTDLASLWPGEVRCVYSQERNRAQFGYAAPFDALIFTWGDRAVLSYGDRAAPKARLLAAQIGACFEIGGIAHAAAQIYGTQPECGVKFAYRGAERTFAQAQALQAADYPLFLDFYKQRAARPEACGWDWLEPYFHQHAADGFFCAVLEHGRIASCTDAPGMPYMADSVQEVGIFTLPAFRGRGYAARACAAAVQNILRSGRRPQWSTALGNAASRRLAARVGFVPFADTCMLTL